MLIIIILVYIRMYSFYLFIIENEMVSPTIYIYSLLSKACNSHFFLLLNFHSLGNQYRILSFTSINNNNDDDVCYIYITYLIT